MSRFTEASRSEESSGLMKAPRLEKAATSKQGSGSKQPSRFNEIIGANVPFRSKNAPGHRNPYNVGRTNPGPNIASEAGPCWKNAIQLLEEKHPNEYNVLLSASQKESLKGFLEHLGSTSGELSKGSKSRIYFERLWRALQPFQRLAMVAARADPHQVAPYAVASLFLLIEVSRGLEHRELIIEIFCDIACMVLRCYHFETRFLNPPDPFLIMIQGDIETLKGRITDLFVEALKLAATTQMYLNASGPKRLVDRILAKRVVWQDELIKLRSIDAWCKARKEVMDAESKFQKDNASILGWITKTDQKQEHKALRYDLGIDNVFRDCGMWLFATPEYRSWKEARDASRPVLWLRGTVGTGKTTLMCRVIEELREEFEYEVHVEHRVIYYYCTGSKPGETRSDCNQCLRALIRQLARKPNDLTIAPSVQHEYQKSKVDDSGDSRFIKPECQRLLQELIPSDPKEMRTTIVIDALDECKDGYELLEILSSLLKSRPQSIRLLLSSQLHVNVKLRFSDNVIQSLQIRDTMTKDDMHNFIRKKMEAVNSGNYILNSKPDLYAEVAGELTRCGKGMFQWVKLRIEIFFPMPPLETTAQVRRELNELGNTNPQDLNPTYRRLYANNVIQSQRQNTAKTYRLILSAYEPLTLKQVKEAVSIENDGKINHEINEEYIRKRCHNFVTENEDGYLQFAHESARLFLERVENHGDKDFVDVDDFSDTANHREMVEICLKLMMRPNHPMWLPGKLSSIQENGRLGCSSRVIETNYQETRDMLEQCELGKGFSTYALSNLGSHCLKLGSTHSLGPALSRDLSKVIFEPNTAIYWWFNFAPRSYGSPRRPLPHVRRMRDRHFYRYPHLEEEVLACMRNNRPPDPFLAICIWDLVECVDELRARLFPKTGEWPSALRLPLDVCCLYGSSQTLSKLIELYPGKVDALIMEAHGLLGRIPIQVAIYHSEVDVTRNLLEFERKRAHTRKEGYWTSKQLLSLRGLSWEITCSGNPKAAMILKMLLEFEADQTGARFPPRSGECWVSELAQYPNSVGVTPLRAAAGGGHPDIVSLLLQAGARLTKISETARMTVLESALERFDSQGSEVVELLLRKFPDDWNIFARDDFFVSYLGERSTVKMATYILQKRPQLIHTPNSQGEKAIKIASRWRDCKWSRNDEWCREAGFTDSRYQQLVDVMLKFGAQIADAQVSTEEMIQRKEGKRRWHEECVRREEELKRLPRDHYSHHWSYQTRLL
ncbi:hypothetical protein GJ744_000908 [Endocarpon pusillum]|uniref:Nephrocystin 3-like N-terminal domain-containing protein n=1 Tax=Endocarpon pusillum TaxID=364733 RepID=A0A8H7ATG6_9EURO|nr:hypothetical protein GJ744_000908 [Endocarpon pusillum]